VHCWSFTFLHRCYLGAWQKYRLGGSPETYWIRICILARWLGGTHCPVLGNRERRHVGCSKLWNSCFPKWLQGPLQASATPGTHPLFPGAIRTLADDGFQAFHEGLAGILQVGEDSGAQRIKRWGLPNTTVSLPAPITVLSLPQMSPMWFVSILGKDQVLVSPVEVVLR
jgi:hypothetical protein